MQHNHATSRCRESQTTTFSLILDFDIDYNCHVFHIEENMLTRRLLKKIILIIDTVLSNEKKSSFDIELALFFLVKMNNY